MKYKHVTLGTVIDIATHVSSPFWKPLTEEVTTTPPTPKKATKKPKKD